MSRMPVLFVGHGSPMNAIERNAFSEAWRELGTKLPRPKGIVAISAHWETRGSYVTAGGAPKTIHDFGGFPQALHDMQYPAPGDDALSARVAALTGARPTSEWGLDHGVWSVLVHLFPDADIPVVQLSIDERADHAAIGEKLAPLRHEGVLIFAGGNIVHNLRAFMTARSGDASLDPRGVRFDARVRDALVARDAHAVRLGNDEDARFSAPTPEHYLPLLYADGAAGGDASVSFPVEGFDGPGISMRSVLYA